MKQLDPIVVVVMGLPGSGKTTFARELSRHLEASYISTDRLRIDLGKRGQYTPETRDGIYRHMGSRLKQLLAQGKRVVLDGTFTSPQWRKLMLQIAQKKNAPFFLINLQASEEATWARTSQKRVESDADYQVYLCHKRNLKPIGLPHLTLNSAEQCPGHMLVKALNYLHHEPHPISSST